MASDEREPDDYDDRRPARRPRDDYDDGPDYSDTPHRGGLILSLGIASIVTSLFGCSPIALVLGGMAWVWGRRDLKAMDRGEMDPEGRWLTLAGFITGIIGTAIGLLMLLVAVVYILFIVAFVAMMPKPAPPAPAPAPPKVAPAPPPVKGALLP